jgi:hypothetical protein
VPGTKDNSPKISAASLATALLRDDWKAALLLYIVLALPGLSQITFQYSAALYQLPLLVGQRVLSLAALYLWGYRCLRILSSGKWRWSTTSFALLLVVGLILWAVATLPIYLLQGVSPDLRALCLALLTIGTTFAYLYYFYFFPLLLNVRNPWLALTKARALLKDHGFWLPLRIEVPTLGLMLLATGAAFISYPDGREPVSAALAEAAQPIAWLLSSYLGIAYGLLALSDSEWRALQLDPYRTERFESLVKRSFHSLTTFLELRLGIMVFLISICLWSGNEMRKFSLPPPGECTVESLKLEEQKVYVTLEVHDPVFALRSFEPLLFTLRGEQGRQVSNPPEGVFLLEHGQRYDARFEFPRDTQAHKIELVFTSQFSADELARFTDVYLWYRGARLLNLRFAQGSPGTANATPSPSSTQ